MQVTRLQVCWMHYFAWYLNHIGLIVDDHEQLSYVLNIKQSVGLFMKIFLFFNLMYEVY